MGWIFVPLILITILFTLFGFYTTLEKYRDDDEEISDDWLATIGCAGITLILLLLYAAFSKSVLINDALIVMWLVTSVAMFMSMWFSKKYYETHNVKGKFKRYSWSAFGIGVLFFVLIGMTAPSDAADNIDSNTKAENEKTEESSSDKAKENTKAEKEDSIEAAQKEKEESVEAAEAKKEESIEAAKVEEESIEKAEAEKKKEESIEAAKAEEASIEKAEAKKQEEEKKAEKEKKEAATPKEGLVPVQLYRVVDGDTVNVIDDNGSTLKLRLLLIDTPETVHPNKPVEPYGKEASARLIDILNAADQLYIEYDNGDKTDHYGRELVYLYADDTNVHETLLREGLARVGYVYEQQRYLSDFREAEQYAKDRELGIWSIPGYVNEGGEGFNSEEPEPEPTSEPATSEPASEPATSEPAQTSEFFQNCTDLRETYPDGVAQGHAAYQSKMDRDKDGWACE